MTDSRVIGTERLILRRPEPRDEGACMAFALSERAVHVGGGPEIGRRAAWDRFAILLGHWQIRGFGLWVVTLRGSDDPVGLVGPWYPETWPEREIGWLIFDGAEGRGIAHEAALAARAHAFRTLGWTTAVSYIAPGNVRSIALAKRLGASLDEAAAKPSLDRPTLVFRHRRLQVAA